MGKVVAVILAGGSGTRLWPLSQPGAPKQFLRLFGQRTLLQQTVERIRDLHVDRILILTGAEQRMETDAQLRELGLDADQVEVLSEPVGRNTAPAIALAAAYLRDRLGPETRMIVLPADHHVTDPEAFRAALRTALRAAEADALITLGLVPTAPETGYGYIQAGAVDDGVAPVVRFTEKPDAERARAFMAAGDHYWNSGVFVWQAGTILRAVWQYLPEVATLAARPWQEFQERFEESVGVSVDYGILEKAANVLMVPASFGWSDVGTWEAVATFLRADGRLLPPTVDAMSDGVDVLSQRPVAVVGLQDILIVDSDEGLLVLKKGHGQDVGRIAKSMTPAGRKGGVQPLPKRVEKPWGAELIWAHTHGYVGKILFIRAGESLSLQYHREKDETIYVLRGQLRFRHGPAPEALSERRMKPGESFHIRPRTVHQMEAEADCEILEVSTPQLDDVVRLQDRYGRAA